MGPARRGGRMDTTMLRAYLAARIGLKSEEGQTPLSTR